jgi:hypothetical protein
MAPKNSRNQHDSAVSAIQLGPSGTPAPEGDRGSTRQRENVNAGLGLIPMEQKSTRNRSAVWLPIIIALGLGIRLTGLWWTQGYCLTGPGDALEAYSVAVDYASGEPEAAYLGQPNYNAHAKLPGPLWSLFCFMGLRAWGSIEGAILGIILLNTASIYICYLLAERTLGPSGSTWTALFAATLPFAVYYSVSLYNPNVMPLLGGLLFLALWEVIQQDRSRGIFWVVLLLLVMPQFHMCVTMLLPALGLVLFLARVRLNLPYLFAGLIAGAVLYVPYLRGEMSHGWQNTLGMLSAPGRFGWGGLKALTAPLSLLTNWVPQWTDNPAAYRQMGRACFGFLGLFLSLNLLSGLVAVSLGLHVLQRFGVAMRGFWHTPRQVFNRSRGFLFLVMITMVPLLCAAASGKNFSTRYAIVLFAPMLTLAGWAAATLPGSLRRGGLFTIALVIVTCGNVWFMPAMFHYQGERIARGGTFLPSFRNLEAVYQQLKAHTATGQGVKVDDAALWSEMHGRDDVLSDALLIRRYVAIREKESAMVLGSPAKSVVYTLRRAEQAPPGTPGVTYRAHGIALIAAQCSP